MSNSAIRSKVQMLNPSTLIINLGNSGITADDVRKFVRVLEQLNGAQVLSTLERVMEMSTREQTIPTPSLPSYSAVAHQQHPVTYRKFLTTQDLTDSKETQLFFGELDTASLRDDPSFPLGTNAHYMERLAKSRIISAADLATLSIDQFCKIISKKKTGTPRAVVDAASAVNTWLLKFFELTMVDEEKEQQ